MEENEKNYLDWEGLQEYHEKLNAELDKKVNSSDLADVATSGNYNDLENTPTNVSQFTNDAGYITSEIDNTNGHDYVEIGGIKWATMNIGAENITDIGLYFQWGDILGYTSEEVGVNKNFTWEDYKFNPSGDGTTFTKYNSTDEKTYLDTEDDAAASAWGSDWRVPSTSELQTLSQAVNVSWTSDYEDSGVSGLILTDKEDSSKVLFLPVTGVCNDGSIIDGTTTGFYWSKSLGNTNDKGFGLGFDETNGATWNYSNSRSLGFAIRPVLEGPEKRTIMGVTQAEKDAWNNSYSKEEINDKLNTLNEKVENPPIASANTLGSIKVGNGLTIDNSGVLSAEEQEIVQTTGTSTTAVISQKGVTDIITENEEIVSTALNDLNDRISSLPSTSEAAVSGGTDLSLVTTGEKSTWNNKVSTSTFTANTTVHVTQALLDKITALEDAVSLLEGKVVAKYNVTESTMTQNIMGWTGRPSAVTTAFASVYVDGNKIEISNANINYTFDTVGEHTVRYELKDPTTINMYTFNGSYNTPPTGIKAVSITIPSSVTSIAASAFYGCRSLTSIEISSGVTTIKDDTFNNCSSLSSITIPDGVTSINSNAFYDCRGLTSIVIPDSVTSIGYCAFDGCRGLTSCTIGSGVTSIGTGAFYTRGNLSEITSLRTTAITLPTSGQPVFNVASSGTLKVPTGSTGYDAWLTLLGSGWSIQYI